MRTDTKVKRGTCPVCGGVFVVTKAGVMRYHSDQNLRREWYGAPDCEGVGQPPKPDPELTVGTLVRKVGGDYTLTGTVIAAFPKLSGQVRYVVETAEGLLLIYSRTNLEVRDGD